MRIIVLHASSSPYIFQSKEDRCLYETLLKSTDFKSLSKRAIVGLALVDLYDPSRHGESEWYIPGSHGYWIQEVIRLPEPIPHKGKLGLFFLPEDVQQTIRRCEKVRDTLDAWEKQCEWGTGLRAVSIRQPPIEAILRGKKNVENRSRSIFKV
jgi:hypothetical protein